MPIPATSQRSNRLALGAYTYAAGASAATVTIPQGAAVFNVAASPTSGGTTGTIKLFSGDTIPVTKDTGPFGINLEGRRVSDGTLTIVFAGQIGSYFVDWTGP